MTEQELRALVRDAIARHLEPAEHARSVTDQVPGPPGGLRHHASHAMFVLPSGADADGPCLIEPAVACNHCGYCKSLGH